jgi:hypothetical protein
MRQAWGRHGHRRSRSSPGGQAVGAAAGRRAGGPGRHETAGKGVEHGAYFTLAGGVEGGGDLIFDSVEHGRRRRPRLRILAALDEAERQSFKPFDAVPVRSPRINGEFVERLRSRPGPRLGEAAIERVEAEPKVVG